VGPILSLLFGMPSYSGHGRDCLVEGEDNRWGVVHVRDTPSEPEGTPIAPLTRAAYRLRPESPVYTALAQMRESGNQLAVVTDEGRMLGVVTLTDVLRKLFPRTTA